MVHMPSLTTPDGTPISSHCFGTMQFGGKADAATVPRDVRCLPRGGDQLFRHRLWLYRWRVGDAAGRVREAGAWQGVRRHEMRASGQFQGRHDHPAVRGKPGNGWTWISSILLYLHRWDDDTPLEETFGALAKMVESGRVRHIGVSNFTAWQVMKAARVAHDFSLPIAMLQPMYNLVKRQVEVEILPMALSEGFAVVPYSPLGGGLLTGKYAGGASGGRITDDPMYKLRYGQDWMHAAAASLSQFAADLGVSPITLAVAWVAKNPAHHRADHLCQFRGAVAALA